MSEGERSSSSGAYVQHVGGLLRHLAAHDSTTYRVMMDTCARDLLSAACGLVSDGETSVDFLVTKSCATFLAECDDSTTSVVKTTRTEIEESAGGGKRGVVQLINALSACCLSGKLSPDTRVWSLRCLLRALSYRWMISHHPHPPLNSATPHLEITAQPRSLAVDADDDAALAWNEQRSLLAVVDRSTSDAKLWSVVSSSAESSNKQLEGCELDRHCRFIVSDDETSEPSDHAKLLTDTCWNANGKFLAVACANAVNVWPMVNGSAAQQQQPAAHVDLQPARVTAMTWPLQRRPTAINNSDDDSEFHFESLLIGREDGSVGLLDVFDTNTFRRQELTHCSRHSCPIVDVSWRRADEPFAIAFADGKIVLASKEHDARISTIDAASRTSRVSWNGAGTLLAVMERHSHTLKLWQLRGDNWHDAHKLAHGSSRVTALEWHRGDAGTDQQMVASGGDDGLVRVWVVSTGHPHHHLHQVDKQQGSSGGGKLSNKLDNLRGTSSSEKVIKSRLRVRPTRSTPSVSGLFAFFSIFLIFFGDVLQ